MKEEPEIVKELKKQEESLSKSESEKSIFIYDEEDEESNLKSDHKTLTNIDEIYKIIFENFSFGITIVDNQERIVSWNTHAEELLNLTENELYFKPVESLYPVEEWEKIRAENVRKKGIKYRMETQLIRKDHGPFDVELSLCVLRGEDGKNVGTLGIIKDISKLKITQNKLDDSEERFKTIFNNSAVAITVTNSKEQIISWNNYAEKLLGYSEKDLIMKHVSILYPPEEWAKIRSENVRQKGMQHHLETKIICKNNKEIDVDISLSVLKNYEGNINGSIGIIRDITKRKFIEVSLEQSEKKFKQLYQQAPVPYHTLSPDGQITDVNNKWCHILGYTKEEVIGKSIFDFIVKDERKEAKNSFKEKMISKKLYTGGHERTFLTKNGEKRIFIINDFFSFDSFDKNHNIRSVHTTMEDITNRKKLEREIKKSKKHFQNLFNNIIDPVVIVDSKGKFLEISDNLEKSTGHKKEDLIGKNFMKVKVVTEKSKRLLLKNLIKRMAGVKIKPYEIEVLTADGRVLPFEINAAKIEYLGKPADMVIFRDISERKKMQKELLESEERFRQVTENAQDLIWEVDANGLYTYTSPAVEKILGYTQKEIVGKKHFYDLFYPEERDTLKKAAFEVFKQKQPFREFLNRNVHKDGNDVWLSTSGFPILDAKGDLIGYRGGDEDITERKKFEEKIIKNEQFLYNIFNAVQNGISVLNKDLIVERINSWVENNYGSKESIIGKKCFEIYQDREDICPWCPAVKTLKDGKSHESIVPFPSEENSVKWFELSSFPLKDENDHVIGIIEYVKDVTDRKAADEEIKKSKKQTEDILNAAADGIRIVGKDFKIIDMNKTMEALIGMNKKEVIGQSCKDLFSSESSKCGTKNCFLLRVLKTGKGFREEEKRKTRDGKIIDCLTCVTPYKDENGNIIGIIEDYRDITEVKKVKEELSEKEKRFKQFFESSPVYCYMVSADGKIIDINLSAMSILDIKNKSDVVGKQIIPIVFSNVAHAKKLQKKWLNKENLRNEKIKIKSSNGEKFVLLSVDNVNDKNGNLLYSILMQIDITDINKAQEELKEKIKQLEKFKKVTVGRELKMIELKEKINELNKEQKIEAKKCI